MLCQPGAGAALTLGTSTATLHSLAPRPLPPIAPMADLGAELFGHLAGLPADGAAAAAVPLVQVALVALAGDGSGGCVLGLRVSHLAADFGTLRALLHQLARVYNRQPLAPADVPAPAAPLVAALAVPPPLGARPHNYLPFPSNIGEQLAAFRKLPPLQGLVLHVPPARLAKLKARAAADLAAAAAAGAAGAGTQAARGGGAAETSAGQDSGEAEQLWLSTNDALMAWLWRTLAGLPCRCGAVVAFNQVCAPSELPSPAAAAAVSTALCLLHQPMARATTCGLLSSSASPFAPLLLPPWQGLDMRRRLPAAAVAACHPDGVTPRWLYGNLATSAYTPPLDAPALPLGEVALELRRTVARCGCWGLEGCRAVGIQGCRVGVVAAWAACVAWAARTA